MVIANDSGTEENRFRLNNETEYTREELAQMFIESVNRIWGQVKSVGKKMWTDLGGYEACDKIARLAAKHPFAALVAMLGVVIVFLPFSILLAFGLSTMAMTFTGFLLLEGTLLTIASVLLFGCLGALLLVFMFFAVITIAGYFGFVHIYDLYSDSNNRAAFRQFLGRERRSSESRN